MVLDHYVCQKAFEGDIDAVKAWLAADPSRDVTDIFESGEGYTNEVNLLCLSAAGQATPAKVALTRWLLAQAKAVVAGVRACGGRWTSYCRLPHKQVLRLRSLVSRGRALPVRTQRRRPRGRDGRQDRVVTFLCKLGDNGVVWKILEF